MLVAPYLSFIATAAEMQLSQPRLSRIIRKVGEDFGVKLFGRTKCQITAL